MSVPGSVHRYTALASRQHGLVTRRQLVDCGVSNSQVDGMLANGRLVAVERGVHLIAGAPFTWRTRLLGACLAVGGMASHRSAAVLLGIDGFRPGRPEVSVGRANHARSPRARVHWSTDLEHAAPTQIDGIPVTSLGRTILDIGSVCDDQVVERSLDWAIARRLLTWAEVLEIYRVHSRPGRRGCGPLRRILEARFEDGHRVESALESDTHRLLVRSGLTGFETQVEVHDGGGFVLRGDFVWTAEKVIVEVDGLAYHLSPNQYPADRAKRTRARLAGWFVFEYTALDIRCDPERVVREIRAVLAERRYAQHVL